MTLELESVSKYTRKQSIKDGILIDISDVTKEVGFQFPVAMTSKVWVELIQPDERLKGKGQTIDIRLWDTLMMLRFAIENMKSNNFIIFKVMYLIKIGNEPESKELKAVISNGNNGETVITIMYKNED